MIHKGVSGSDGIAAAPVYLYCQDKIVIDHALMLPEQENEELDQLKKALEISIMHMNALRTKAAKCFLSILSCL